jgi:WD40 repeat protein
MPKHSTENEEDEIADNDLPTAASAAAQQGNKSGFNDIPVHERGTPLVRGHEKEVTSLSWTYDGELVTVSDDFSARCWREDGSKARDLRGCGESGGQRWRCGWAAMGIGWDEEDA